MKHLAILVLVLIVFGLVGQGDYDEARKEHTHYCAMVDTWERFQGTRGHPNYEDRDCSQELKAFVRQKNAEISGAD